jgi:hypothetical protein
MGRLIPAGTGVPKYSELDIEMKEPEEEVYEEVPPSAMEA